MANTSLVKDKTFAQKKSHSLFAGRLVQSAAPGEGEFGIAAANYKLANLPAHAIITDAYVMVNTASDAATSATISLGTAEAGTEILSAADVKVLGEQGTFTGKFDTGSGAELFMRYAAVGSSTAVADVTVVVEYVEYEKTTGEYTRF